MKTILAICTIGLSLTTLGCGSNSSGKGDGDTQTVENKFTTAAAALEQTKNNLHLILTENQRKTFGLKSDDEIKALTKVAEIPVSYLALGSLRDSALNLSDEGYLYGLGNGQSSKICISVTRNNNEWMQSAVGMNKIVHALNDHPGASRLVDVPGLDMSFLEHSDSTGKVYMAINDYPEAGISERNRYSQAEMLRLLENYRAGLEKQYGKDYSNGNLEK